MSVLRECSSSAVGVLQECCVCTAGALQECCGSAVAVLLSCQRGAYLSRGGKVSAQSRRPVGRSGGGTVQASDKVNALRRTESERRNFSSVGGETASAWATAQL